MGLHELGPLAQTIRRRRASSTCTVFAGAELRDRLRSARSARTSWRACTARSSCAPIEPAPRSGGVADEFTFTGGVANNEAAVASSVRCRRELRRRHAQHNAGSIYTGALGAAMFAHRADLDRQRRSPHTIAAGIDVGTGPSRRPCSGWRTERPRGSRARSWASASAIPWSSRASSMTQLLAEAGVRGEGGGHYVATTGEGEGVRACSTPANCYSMTTLRAARSTWSRKSRAALRRRRPAWSRHQHRRARQGAGLQDDQPARVGIGPVPQNIARDLGDRAGRDRHLSRQADDRDRQQYLRGAGGDRR